MASRQPSSAVPLALACAAIVVYASLYPLSAWHHPQGLWSLAFLSLPWPRWWTWFDVVANLLGYVPLGALLCVGALRTGRSRRVAVAVAIALPSLLSLMLELTQNYLPQRVPSALDWVLNSAGAALGAVLAALADRAGLTLRWQSVRERWFVGGTSGALTLLLLWPFGLLFPAPVPFGLGQIWPRVLEALASFGAWIQGVPWLAGWTTVLPSMETSATRLPPLAEATLTAFGLLAPSLLAYTASRPGWRRLMLVLGAAVLGLASTTLSTALSFGPQHALAWLTPTTLPAIGAAMILATLAVGVSRRAAAALGLVAATALVVLSAQAPSDPYFADSLQAWEQGRFIRFHGVAQWLGWLWPYVLLAYLLRRVGARDDGLRG